MRETESARALLAKKEDVVSNVQKMLAKLAHEAFDLNLLDAAKEKTVSLCVLLERVTAGIMAKHDIEGYDVHQAVLDFVAQTLILGLTV